MKLPNNFPVATAQRLSGLRDKVVLTYDNAKMTDGAGAQLQRIYGTYAISRLLGASYFHTPLGRVDYQGFSALERNVIDPAYHQQFNDLFQIESDVMPSDKFHKIELPNISMEIIRLLVGMIDAGATDGRPCLVQLAVPYGIADQCPDCYKACREISPFASPVSKNRALRVALHVRRGELLVVDSDRILPNAYYVRVAQNLTDLFETLGIDYQIELHTETATAEFIVQPSYPGIADRIAATAVRPDMCRLDEFSVLPNLVRYINEPAIDCLRQLATADILVMSRSSFSYVGAILNRTGIILCYPFWHSSPSWWLTVGPDGQFDRSKFVNAVQSFHLTARTLPREPR
jgi:hypothetical protein